PHRVLIGSQRILPALLGIADELPRRCRSGIALRVETLEGLIDLVDVIGHTLRLVEELLRAFERLHDRLQARIGQISQVLRLIEQHLRLVLQAGNLVVDLLQRAGGLQHVLGVIRGVIDGHLRADWRREGYNCDADGGDQPHLPGPAKAHCAVCRAGVVVSCGFTGSRASKSAAQSRPLRCSQAAAKSLWPDSASAMAASSALEDAAVKARATSPSPSSNRRLPRRD